MDLQRLGSRLPERILLNLRVPERKLTVERKPDFFPRRVSSWWMRYTRLLLPSVPVTPITVRDSDGRPWNAADTGERAARDDGTCRWITPEARFSAAAFHGSPQRLPLIWPDPMKEWPPCGYREGQRKEAGSDISGIIGRFRKFRDSRRRNAR
jgi:hypothetical protein